MKLNKITVSVLSILSSLSLATQVNARMIYSAMFFEGVYQNRSVYGVMNVLDNQVCTFVDGNFVRGTANNIGYVRVSSQRHLTIVGKYILNPYGSTQVPKKWSSSAGFKKCEKMVSFAKCSLPVGSVYYNLKEGREDFLGIIKQRTTVYVKGNLTNLYSVKGETARDGWAALDFYGGDNDAPYIVESKLLQCGGK